MQTVHDTIADALAASPGERVGDLGSGSGATLRVLAARADRWDLTAVDVDPEALGALAATRGGVRTVRADLAAMLPFADATFDALVCHNTLECLVDPGALLAEAVGP